jgi:hypothetical protein
MIKIIATILSTLAACGFAFLGYLWNVDGYGLNPVISYPAATICFFSPIVLEAIQRGDQS